MAKGRWKRRLGWGLVILIVCGIIAAVTWRAWAPAAIKLVLQTRGIKVKSVAWEGKDFLKLEGIERVDDGRVIRIGTLTTMTPRAWKRSLREIGTNEAPAFLTVNSWRIIATNQTSRAQSTNSIAEKIRAFQAKAQELRTNCPRAVFLNGALQTPAGEFLFATVEWKNGQLSGDFRWPRLNDPADFKLNLTNATKTLLIAKQTALEMGSRITAEQVGENIRLAGYARWLTNRADFDLTFSPDSNQPRQGFINSKGLTIPGNLIGLRSVEQLRGRLSLVLTNGQFDFRYGAPEEIIELSP